jgi:brefeldin A-resistance guanine nucleotide exchange factor 1
MVFELLKGIVESMPDIVTADNYKFTISLANDFVSAAHVGSITERRRDGHIRRTKSVKQPKPTYDSPYYFTPGNC